MHLFYSPNFDDCFVNVDVSVLNTEFDITCNLFHENKNKTCALNTRERQFQMWTSSPVQQIQQRDLDTDLISVHHLCLYSTVYLKTWSTFMVSVGVTLKLKYI